MPELHLQRNGSILDVIVGEHKSSLPLADVALNATTWEGIYDDAVTYGRDLFDKTFRDEQVRTILTNLPVNERLLLVAEDPLVAAIPWEYLRDQNNKLLASRLNFVRGILESERKDNFSFNGLLEIIAIPVSPVDEPRILNVEGEWKNLVEAVTLTNPPKALTLKRIRPPTRSQLERSLSQQCISIVHFMGHSTSHAGKAFLAFEDARARSHLVDAADFADSLNSRIFLVVLNSCLSAVVAPTEFGNIAQALVHRGVPYALGMQFILPDDAALVLSDALYDFLLQGHNVEEAVMHTRRALEEPGKLANPAWLVGIPVLYTSLRTPASPIELTSGQPSIQPDPVRLQKMCDLTALPPAPHFLGRSAEISEVLDALLSHRPADFVVLHGLGGIGKTSLARVGAERVSYHYGDRVLAVSFETLAPLDAQGQAVVDEYFADRFYNQLAHFYDLDPAAYTKTADLQRAILQRHLHIRSLLVLDNMETLIDAQGRGHPAAKALAAFISRLKEGDGAILLTTRIVPPSDWGDCRIISISGLDDDAGGSLLLTLLPPDRRAAALPDMHRKLSQRVKGHPLSIRLLAGRFAEATTDLKTFLKEIDAELQTAEQATPTSIEDPARQATLYACMDYSVKHLTLEQREVLDAISLFQAPFPPLFAETILGGEERTQHHLQSLSDLGLLNMEVRSFPEGELFLLELHPMLRWYVLQHLKERDPALLKGYGYIYMGLVYHGYGPAEGGYDRSSLTRYLIRQSLPDCEAALQHLPPHDMAEMAYHLALPYHRLGQNRRAVALYERALEIAQNMGDIAAMANIQSSMANVLVQQGKEQEAMVLYEQAMQAFKELGDVLGVATVQGAMADVLMDQGKLEEARSLNEEALRTKQEVGNAREVATTQRSLADVLKRQGKLQEAMALYQKALQANQELRDVRGVAVVQGSMADLLERQGKLEEALALYEQALQKYQEVDNIRGIAVMQHAMADILLRQGKSQEALALYEQALRMKQEVGEVPSIVLTQHAMAGILLRQGKSQEALALYEQVLRTYNEVGDRHNIALTQHAMADALSQQGKSQEALALYEQALRTQQEVGDTLGAAVTQGTIANVLVQQGRLEEARVLYEQAMQTCQRSGNMRALGVIQHKMADLLERQGKLEEALVLYEQTLRTFRELGDTREVANAQKAIADVLRIQDKRQEALALYKQILPIYQKWGDSRSVAVVQSAMADIIALENKLEEALALYEQALQTCQEVEDVHSVAVIQGQMATLLALQGKLEEAQNLYEHSLKTLQELGDIQEMAATQAAFHKFWLLQGEHQRALDMAWQAYKGVSQHGFSSDTQVAQQLLIDMKQRILEPAQFDALWEQLIDETQPDWLRTLPERVPDQQLSSYPEEIQEVLQILVNNTVTAMTVMPETRDKWRDHITEALKNAENDNIAECLAAILAILNDQAPSLPKGHVYADVIAAIQAGIAAGGPLPGGIVEKLMKAVHDFVHAKDWTATRKVVEAQQKLLFRPEVETYFEQNIAHERSTGNLRAAKVLEMHLALLRQCKKIGIVAAFAQLERRQEENMPFDSELISRSIAALLGGPQEKMGHMQYLVEQANKTTDEDLKALINTIQLALFSPDLSPLGRDLKGIYRQAWETINAGVESEGVDPHMFEIISNNTLVVLGPTPSRRSDWRTNLVQVRNQATAHGNRNMAALLDAVIGLLDADGSPADLGEGLKGVYAKTWQAIVKGLPK